MYFHVFASCISLIMKTGFLEPFIVLYRLLFLFQKIIAYMFDPLVLIPGSATVYTDGFWPFRHLNCFM
jgi:hypothetical protein